MAKQPKIKFPNIKQIKPEYIGDYDPDNESYVFEVWDEKKEFPLEKLNVPNWLGELDVPSPSNLDDLINGLIFLRSEINIRYPDHKGIYMADDFYTGISVIIEETDKQYKFRMSEKKRYENNKLEEQKELANAEEYRIKKLKTEAKKLGFKLVK